MAHGAMNNGTFDGTTNGPVMIDADCIISETLMPNMIRREGEFNPPDFMMPIAIREDDKNDTDPEKICKQ